MKRSRQVFAEYARRSHPSTNQHQIFTLLRQTRAAHVGTRYTLEMSFRLFSRARSEIIVVVDIASVAVSVGIVECSAKSSRVLTSARALLPAEQRSTEQTASRLATELQVAATKALTAYAKTGQARPIESVYVAVHGPWCHSAVTKASTSFPADTKITGKIIGALAHECLQKTEGINRNSLLEASVIRVELNGYPTANPEGRSAMSATVYALMSDSDPILTSNVAAVLQALFPGAKLLWRSSTRELCSVLNEIGIDTESYVIVDLQAEATDFIVVEQGVPKDHFIAQLGSRTMLEKISPGALPEDTLATIQHILREQCDDAPCEQIAENIAKLEPEFARMFGEAFARSLTRSRLPNRLILVSRNDEAEWLTRLFTRIDFSQFTETFQPFTVSLLTEKELGDKVRLPVADNPDDLSLSLIATLAMTERET